MRRSLLIGALGVAAICLGKPSPAHASVQQITEEEIFKSPYPKDHPMYKLGIDAFRDAGGNIEEIKKAIRNSSVRILSYGSGSGVITEINSEGKYKVVTAWHVIKDKQDSEDIYIITSDGVRHKADAETMQVEGSDLAVITFKPENGKTYHPVNPSISKLSSGDIIFAVGYPVAGNGKAKISHGVIVDPDHIGTTGGYSILHTAETEAGMSGGLLINIKGELVAIHGRGEQDIRAKKNELGIVKSGVNFAMPYSLAKERAEKKTDIENEYILENYNPSKLKALAKELASIKPSHHTARKILEVANSILRIAPKGSPEIALAYGALDLSYGLLGDKEREAHYSKLYAEETSSWETSKNEHVISKANSLMDLGKYREAIAILKEKESINTGSEYFYSMLSFAYSRVAMNEQKAGNTENAKMMYKNAHLALDKAIEIKPEDKSNQWSKVSMYWFEGNENVHRQKLEDFLRKYPDDPRALTGISNYQAKDGNIKNAFDSCGKAIDLTDPGSPMRGRVLAECAGLAFDVGNMKLAKLLINSSIAIDPGNTNMLGLRAIIHDELGMLKESCADFSRAASLGDKIAIEEYKQRCQNT